MLRSIAVPSSEKEAIASGRDASAWPPSLYAPRSRDHEALPARDGTTVCCLRGSNRRRVVRFFLRAGYKSRRARFHLSIPRFPHLPVHVFVVAFQKTTLMSLVSKRLSQCLRGFQRLFSNWVELYKLCRTTQYPEQCDPAVPRRDTSRIAPGAASWIRSCRLHDCKRHLHTDPSRTFKSQLRIRCSPVVRQRTTRQLLKLCFNSDAIQIAIWVMASETPRVPCPVAAWDPTAATHRYAFGFKMVRVSGSGCPAAQ